MVEAKSTIMETKYLSGYSVRWNRQKAELTNSRMGQLGSSKKEMMETVPKARRALLQNEDDVTTAHATQILRQAVARIFFP